MPEIETVSPSAFRAALANQHTLEKAHTRAGDALAAQRRALPAVHIPSPEQFTWLSTPDGATKTLLDLFEGRSQLILYNFMLKDTDKEGCKGCSFLVDNLPTELRHLQHRDTTLAIAAEAGVERIGDFRGRMGWEGIPWYSAAHTFTQADANGVDRTFGPRAGLFSLEVFRRKGNDVFHTYSTTNRGTEVLDTTYALLDLTKKGRQEEDRAAEYKLDFKLHDMY